MTEQAKPPFDAKPHIKMIKVKGQQGLQPYLGVWGRVAYLRYEHPTAQVVSEETYASDNLARFKCTITLPNGAIAVGHGSCAAKEFPDFYEKAESGALARACAVLGYGTETEFAEAPADHAPRVQLNDRLTEKQQAWMATEGLARGIRMSDRPQLWSTVIGIMSKAGVNMEGIADDHGIIAEEVANRLHAVPLVRQPGSPPPAAE